MQLAKYDASLSFGAIELGSNTVASANVLNLDKADPARMAVNFIVTTAAAGGTSVVLKIQGSNNNSNWNEVSASPSIVLANLTKDANFTVAIPSSWNYKYMRVAATCTGTFTAGKISAAMDVYQGV